MSKYKLEVKTKKIEGDRCKVLVGPLERGFGHTLGSALRRTMLANLAGAAITELRIDGVSHEFSTMEGVREDVLEIILNLKKINFKMSVMNPQIVTLEVKGEKEVKAGDLKCPTGVEVLNPEQVIAYLTDKKSSLSLELKIEFDRGYRLVDQQDSKVGIILMDADFNPVRNVSYKVEPARVGKVTGLDQIVFDIETNGSISAQDALLQSAALLSEQVDLLSKDIEIDRVWEEVQEVKKVVVEKKKPVVYLEEFNLPTRLLNALRGSGIQTVEDVKSQGEEGLMKIKNVGPKSVRSVLEAIEERERDA